MTENTKIGLSYEAMTKEKDCLSYNQLKMYSKSLNISHRFFSCGGPDLFGDLLT